MTDYSGGFAVVTDDPATADIDDVILNRTSGFFKRWNGSIWVTLGPGSAPDVTDPFGHGLIYTVDPMYATATATWPTANRAVAHRVIGGGAITKLGIRVGVQSGNICLAIFRANGAGRATGTLNTRVVTTGAIACPASGWAEVDLGGSFTINPGDWIAMSCDNTTASFYAVNNNGAIDTSPVHLGRSSHANGAHPVGSTFNTTVASFNKGFLIVGVP